MSASPAGTPVTVSAWADEDAAVSRSESVSACAGSPGSFRRPAPPTRQAPSLESRRLSAPADGEPDELALPAVAVAATPPRTGMQIPPARSERSASAAPLQMGRPRSSMPPPLAGSAQPFAIPPSPAAVGNAALSDALQKRFEAEFNRRHQSELHVQAISKQMDVERAELAAVKEQLAECQRALQLSQTNASEYAATQARLKQQVAELSSEKAMLASQVLALEEQLEELTIPPPPPVASDEADADTQAAPQKQPSILSPTSVLPTAPAPAAPSAGDFAMLQARCAHFERLWRAERAERESLEIAIEARDIADSSAGDADSIRPIHFHNNANGANGSSSADTVVGQRGRSRASSGLFVSSEGRPSAISRAEASPVHRQVPDDLEGFDTGSTIRLKPGSMPPPTATTVFAPSAAPAAAASATTATESPPPASTSTDPTSLPSSPSITPARPGSFPPAPVTLPSTPAAAAAAAAAASTVVITELDSGAIASLFSAKYRWSSSVHREYFRREIDELLESCHDEDTVRAELRLLELQCIAPLQYELVEKIGAGGFGCVYRALPRPAGAGGDALQPTSPLSGAAGCSVAIKVINLEDTTDDLANICREISAISEGNSCAQLTRYYGSAVLGTKLWVVMEFVDGGSVLDFIKEKRALLEQRALRSLLPTAAGGERGSSGGVAAASEPELGLDERYIAIIVREVLWALLFLEKQKKFHRDLKAANVRTHPTCGVRMRRAACR